VKITETNYN